MYKAGKDETKEVNAAEAKERNCDQQMMDILQKDRVMTLYLMEMGELRV